MIVVLVAVLAMATLLALRVSFGLSDQGRYLDAALFPDSAPNHWSTRLGFVLPVSWAIRAVGLSEAAVYAVPILMGTLLVVATYLLGRVLFGRGVGLAAAALILTLPWVLPVASDLMPDVGFAALITASLTAVIGAAPTARFERDQPRTTLLLILAGILFGWAYLTREIGLILLPIPLLVGLLAGVRWRSLVHFAWPVALAGVGEAVYGWVVWGSPLTHLHVVVERSAAEVGELTEQLSAEANALQTSWSTLGIFPEILLEHPVGWLVLGLMVALAAVAVVRRDRRLVLLLVWASTIWLALTLAGLVPRVIRLTVDRYWLVMFPPLLVGGLGALSQVGLTLWRSRSGRSVTLGGTLVVAVTAAGIALGVSASLSLGGFVALGSDHYQELRAWLAERGQGETVLWSDDRNARFLPIYTRDPWGREVWSGEARSLNHGFRYLDPAAVEGIVVINHETLNNMFRRIGVPVSGPVVAPARYWEPAAITENGLIFTYLAPSQFEGAATMSAEQPVPWVGSVARAPAGFVLDGEPFPLAEGDRIRVLYRPRATAPVPVAPGSVLEMRIELGMDRGTARFSCEFADAAGNKVLVRGLAVLVPPHPLGEVAVYCPAPETLKGPLQAVAIIALRGPATVQLGEVTGRQVEPELLP